MGCSDGSVAVFDVASAQAYVYGMRHEGPVTHLAWVLPCSPSWPCPTDALQQTNGSTTALHSSSHSSAGSGSSSVLPAMQPSSPVQGPGRTPIVPGSPNGGDTQGMQEGPHSQGQLLAGAQLWSLGSEGCLLAWPSVVTPTGHLKQSSPGSAGGGGRGGRGRGGRGGGRGSGSQGATSPQQQPSGPQPTALLPKVEAALQAAAAAADVSTSKVGVSHGQAAVHSGIDAPLMPSTAAAVSSDATTSTEGPTPSSAPAAAAAGNPAAAARPRPTGASRQQQGWDQLHITSMALQPPPGCLLALGGSKGELLLLQSTPDGSSSRVALGAVGTAGGSTQLPGLRVVAQMLLEGGALAHLAWSESGGAGEAAHHWCRQCKHTISPVSFERACLAFAHATPSHHSASSLVLLPYDVRYPSPS